MSIWIIDEPSLSTVGKFDTDADALAYLTALMSVNDDDFLDELTVSRNEERPMSAREYRERTAKEAGQ